MKISKRTTAFALLLIILAASSRLYASESAKSLYKQGHAAEAQQDYDAAFSAYRKATLDDPGNLKYKVAFERTRPLASEQHVKRGKDLKENGKVAAALTEFLRAAVIDPSNESAEQVIASPASQITPSPPKSDIPQLPAKHKRLVSLGSPVDLTPISDEPITLHMMEDSKVIYDSLCKAAGVNVLFDPNTTLSRFLSI